MNYLRSLHSPSISQHESTSQSNCYSSREKWVLARRPKQFQHNIPRLSFMGLQAQLLYDNSKVHIPKRNKFANTCTSLMHCRRTTYGKMNLKSFNRTKQPICNASWLGLSSLTLWSGSIRQQGNKVLGFAPTSTMHNFHHKITPIPLHTALSTTTYHNLIVLDLCPQDPNTEIPHFPYTTDHIHT